VEDMNVPDGNTIADKVKINLNMLGVLVLNGVGGEVVDADVVTVDRVARDRGLCSSTSSCRSQYASVTPLATARYYASVLEWETTF
jgi:hypothetical protein